MRILAIAAAALLLAAPVRAQTSAPDAPPPAPAAQPAVPPAPQPAIPPLPTPPAANAEHTAALEAALRNFPPLILGANVQPTLASGAMTPLSCPATGARVEQRGGPAIEYLGPSPDDADLCRMKAGDRTLDAWYGIWPTAQPGAEFAHRALQRLLRSRTGDVVGFDTVAGPDAQWHDLIRLEGIEDITLLDKTYKAMKFAHYREGYAGNAYRAVTTLWKDIPTGMLIYATYQHIAGKPELDDLLIPTAIVPAP